MNSKEKNSSLFSFILFCSFILLQACCKIDCSDHNKLSSIRFSGYNAGEVSSMKVVKYQSNNNLASPIDTFLVDSSMVYSNGTSIDVSFPSEKNYIDAMYDYKLILHAGLEITLTDFAIESQECKCNWRTVGSHIELVSYTINGKTVNKGYLEIVK